jgi:capsular exopolysaccharide synthesis family protein
MELIRYWRVLRRWAWLVILCPLVAGLAAGVLSFELPKVYEAKAALLVRPAQPLAVEPGGVALTTDQILRTYARLMTERPMLEQVIADEGLETDPVSLSHNITVTPDPNTAILDVAVRDTDPARSARVANTLVGDFTAKIKEIQKAEAAAPTANSADNLVVWTSAVQPTQPVFPKPLLNIPLGILAGLIVGFGFAFLLNYLDQSVRSDDVLRERIGLVPLGHISYVPARSDRRGELVTLNGNSPAVEAYKSLRTNILFSSVDREVKTIVVTSAMPNEGKSRTAANLAIVLAQAGHPTLLVDADFRRPSLHRMFGRVRNMGLSNLIVQDMPESALFVPDEQVTNLVVLASGPTPPNPSELLGSGQMKALLDRFRRGFAYVVIDTPPVNSVTDALVLSANADATALVVDTNKATYPAVQHAKEALERVGAKVLGSVMNKMKTTGGSYYYYEYGYGYAHPNGKPAPVAAARAAQPPALGNEAPTSVDKS